MKVAARLGSAARVACMALLTRAPYPASAKPGDNARRSDSKLVAIPGGQS